MTSTPEADWVARHVSALAGAGGSVPAGGERRSEVFAAWRQFFEALAEARPLVLVFEDLHWADDGLLDFIDYLTGLRPSPPSRVFWLMLGMGAPVGA